MLKSFQLNAKKISKHMTRAENLTLWECSRVKLRLSIFNYIKKNGTLQSKVKTGKLKRFERQSCPTYPINALLAKLIQVLIFNLTKVYPILLVLFFSKYSTV